MLELHIIQSGITWDVSPLLISAQWSGRKGAAGRSFKAILMDAPDFDRSLVDVCKGCQCIVMHDGTELFRGLVTTQQRSNNGILTISAMDNLIYLANNDDTFHYTDDKASDIFLDICKQFEIDYDVIADTKYVIPSLSIEHGTLWDCLLEALQCTYLATGGKFYIESQKGKLSLFERQQKVQEWVLASGENLSSFDFCKSIEDIITRVEIISEKGVTVATARDSELEKKIGIFQKVIQNNDDLNMAQLQQNADNTLKLEGLGTEQLSVTGIGIPSVTAGCVVYLIIPDLDIKSSYYVDEDSHSFNGSFHEMSLTLNKADIFPEE